MTKLRVRGPEVIQAIRCREIFDTTTGNLRGGPVTLTGGWAFGQLPREDQERFEAQRPAVDYVVWSYQTPIGWHLSSGEWIIPDVRYSRTTSCHQSEVRQAAAEPVPAANDWRADYPPASARQDGATRLPSAEHVRRESAQALDMVSAIDAALAEYEHPGDDFAPDNGAPVEYDASNGYVFSGEGAIYSTEYLEAKHGRTYA